WASRGRSVDELPGGRAILRYVQGRPGRFLRGREGAVAISSRPRLFPDQHVGQCGVRSPQQRVADAGKAAKQTQIELPLAAVPAEIAGRAGVVEDRLEPLRG